MKLLLAALLLFQLHADDSLPATLEPVFQRAVAAIRAGQLDSAKTILLDVIRRGGDASFVHHNLAIVYQNQNNPQQAAAEFREALRRNPNYAPSHFLLGVSLSAAGQLPDAIPAFQDAARLAPNDPSYAFHLGRAYQKLAAAAVLRIVETNPNSARFWQLRGEAEAAQGRRPRAMEAFRKAIAADPAQDGSHLALAVLLLQEGKDAEALAELDLELAIAPDSAVATDLKRRTAGKGAPPQP